MDMYMLMFLNSKALLVRRCNIIYTIDIHTQQIRRSYKVIRFLYTSSDQGLF